MSIPTPASCRVSPEAGTMSNGTGHYEKRLSDLAGLYADQTAFAALLAEGDRVVYDVTEFRPSEKAGDVIFGVTRMSPGRIGDEFFLTRGHIHAKSDRPEIYYGQKGTGLMQLESPDGETRIVEIGPQTICYVPPYWIHRSVNIGDEDLVMVFCYPADSGQDYGIIERSGGMRHRVVAVDDGWTLTDNTSYVPRPPEVAAALVSNAV
ncbi:glucose-6-phosphate isomerase [Paracoccus sp. J56]|uniref:glucose-6-phosphate isomerase n=1 Tax=Paracoccus sp. J56 TaxID=935850 RepID=UPI000A09EE15|nr:glucose-6-phosphate isomerase [Paracoccus sp. J56]SMG19117.1 glucose-6-phosphate isomerase [Paracoccus sp. J56]